MTQMTHVSNFANQTKYDTVTETKCETQYETVYDEQCAPGDDQTLSF